MFNYEMLNNKYYISIDDYKGKFGPFKGVFVRNKYLGDINKNYIDENKYPGYKYSIGFSNKSMFIISQDKKVDIIKL